jgi:uncharacterized membrane-anchored protein
MAILHATTSSSHELLSKVPQVTALFWVTKIFATTFGETAGDAVSMSLNLGYLISNFIFAFIFIALVIFQIRAKTYQPFLYWFTIIASTTVGTTLADFMDRSLGDWLYRWQFIIIVVGLVVFMGMAHI